jgi:DNA polymerase-4
MGAAPRKIIHVDMDCFFAAVEERDRPGLRGRPIAVGGRPEARGVIATANYEARRFGVRSAMASAKAARLCPELVLIRPDFAKYKAESRKIRAILGRFAGEIEPLSLDEAYLDVTNSLAHAGSATRIAQEIRALIKAETGLTASAGIGPNKFIAKVASDWNKPDGQKTVRPEEVAQFARELPVEKIWGVGRVTSAKMRALGLRTCGDLQALSLAELTATFGSWSSELYAYARGEDDRPVHAERERKSLSVESTYPQDLKTLRECLAKIDELYQEWDQRVQRARGSSAWREEIRGIFVKIKFHDFRSMTRESAFSSYPVAQDFKNLLERAHEARPESARLLGLGVRFEVEKRVPAARGGPQLAFSLEEEGGF